MTPDLYQKAQPIIDQLINAKATPEEIDIVLKEQFQSSYSDYANFKKTPQAPAVERGDGFLQTLDDFGRSVADAATFGYADELAAGINSLLGRGNYEDLVARERARDKAIPTSTKITGGLAGGLSTALMFPGSAFSRLFSPTTFKKAAAIGGGQGGLYASGSAEGDIGDRLDAVPGGVTTGALFGVAAKPVAQGLSKLAGGAADMVRKPSSIAIRKLAEYLEKDGLTGERLRARLQNLGPRAMLTDAGGSNVQALAKAAAAQPGKTRRAAETRLGIRARGSQQRLLESFRQGLGQKRYFDTEDELLDNLRTQSNEFYEQAYNAVRNQRIGSPEITEILDTPAGKKALRVARNKLVNDRAIFPQQRDAIDSAIKSLDDRTNLFPLRALDYVKRGLDDQIGLAINAGKKDEARILTNLKNDFVSKVDKLDETGAYATARSIWSDDKSALDALELGRKSLNSAPDVIRRQIEKLPNEAAKEAYRAGAMEGIRSAVSRKAPGQNAANMFASSEARGRFRALFPDNKSYVDAMRAITREARFGQTKNASGLGGSPTAPLMATQRDMQIDPNAAAALIGDAMKGRATGLIGQLVAKLKKPDPDIDDELAKRLFSNNAEVNQDTINKIVQIMRAGNISQNRTDRIFNALTRAAVVAENQ